MGPLANPRRVTAMAEFLDDAVQHGAEVRTGGARVGSVGNFFAPTILDNVPLTARVFNDEPFGPVAAVRGFTDLQAASQRMSFMMSAADQVLKTLGEGLGALARK